MAPRGDIYSSLEDRGIWARGIILAKRKLKLHAPHRVDLTEAILDIRIKDVHRGSSTIEVDLIDPDLEMVDAGFFDVDEDGKPDPLDINYPPDSELWWRLSILDMTIDGGGANVTLTFMERAAKQLMRYHGPKKSARGKSTRAEFLGGLVDEVEENGGLRFRCKQLHDEQPIKSESTPQPEKSKDEKSKDEKKKNKDRGINSSEVIRFKDWSGSFYTLTAPELRNAEKALAAAEATTKGYSEPVATRAVLACLCACIVEAPMFRNPTGGDATSSGILQLLSSTAAGLNVDARAIAAVVTLFMERGFYGRGGALDQAKKDPGKPIGQIAQDTQGSAFPDRYGAVLDGAKQVLAAGGGPGGLGAGAGSTTTVKKRYFFEVGSPDNPHEDYWKASNRLAEEVNWPYFVDGQDVYYDSEMTLIQQKPVAIIRRGAPQVGRFHATWDGRHIATEATIDLICDPFEFRAGEVFKLADFAFASAGSTADLPGRWLISEVSRSRYDLLTTFTLKQPEKPKKEPANETVTKSGKDGSSEITVAGDITPAQLSNLTPKRLIEQIVVPIARKHGIQITAESVAAANARHGTTVSGGPSDHQGPPDVAWAADMSDGSSPTPGMSGLADELAKVFGFPVSSDHVYPFSPSPVIGGWRFQLGYKTNEGGNHFNHVHFGARIVSRGPQGLPG